MDNPYKPPTAPAATRSQPRRRLIIALVVIACVVAPCMLFLVIYNVFTNNADAGEQLPSVPATPGPTH